MTSQVTVSDTFTLAGESIERLRQALAVVAHQARLAQHAGYGRNIMDELLEIEEIARDHAGRIEAALDDDKVEAEESGYADRQRQAWHPLYSAA